MRQHRMTSSYSYDNLEIKAAEGYPCHSEILQVIEHTMTAYLERHSKMFVMTLTFTFPSDEYIWPDNSIWQRFMNSLIIALKRLSTELDPQYIWVREQNEGEHQHYHLILFLNGHRVQHTYGICEKAIRLWGQTVGGSCGRGFVHFHTSNGFFNGVRVIRGDGDTFGKVFNRLSYYAKTATKGHPAKPPNVREFGHSTIR